MATQLSIGQAEHGNAVTALLFLSCLRPSSLTAGDDNGEVEEIEPIVGNNWMKRLSSVDFNLAELSGSNCSGGDSKSVYMDVVINNLTFHTSNLSHRMHEATMRVATKKFPGGSIPEELGDVYLLYLIDVSTKEAVCAVMAGNGYALNLGSNENMQDEGTWEQITDVVLVDVLAVKPIKGQAGETLYASLIDAIARGDGSPEIPKASWRGSSPRVRRR
mmetsp:Transcript_55935/g.118947  ORF Transcript_55935/g.118947 Transcript_55935/m.118947 type:complete len:218 (+) Transcript_55935:464-1117(+)